MRKALLILVAFLCSAMVFLVAAQPPSELGRYQIATDGDVVGGMIYQLDTSTGRLYAREVYQGRVYDLGTLDKPLSMLQPLR